MPAVSTGIKKSLALGSHALSDSLKRMKELGVIYLMKDNRYELTVRKSPMRKLENLRRAFEKFVQVAYGSSLAWGLSVSLDKNGNPLIETANIGPDLDQLIEKSEKGEEAVMTLPLNSGLRKLMERFNKFVEQNCERCEHGLFATDEKDLQAGVPDQWCYLFSREIQPKEFNPAFFADGCKYLKKRKLK